MDIGTIYIEDIAKNLSEKGEVFAADMVHATASSIRRDLVKEASKKHVVLSELKKIASELQGDGSSFASDLVLATVAMNRYRNL